MSNPPGWNSKPPVVLPSISTKGQKVNLDDIEFDDLVTNQGVRVKVYRTSYCPNVKSIDGAEHEIDCELCHGSQFIDRYPIETRAFIQTQKAEQMPFVEGMYDGNSVSATFLKGIELQYFTLVELCDFSEVYLQRVSRQEGKIDVLKYKGLRVNMLIDSQGREYYEGSDFNLDVNGNISWKSNKGPLVNQIYTVNYETAVRFRATRSLHSNRFANITTKQGDVMTKMPEQWLLEKDYLVTRKTIDGEVIEPNKIPDHEDSDDFL